MREVISLQTTIFLLVWIGYVVKKRKIIGSQGQKNLTDLVIYVILPCNILKAFMAGQAGEHLKDYLVDPGDPPLRSRFSVHFTEKLSIEKKRSEDENVWSTVRCCSNAGFLGNPIAEGVFGAEGLVLASFFLIPQRIMMWSAGLAVFTGSTDRKATAKKVLTHPCIIACVIGLILMLGKIKLPAGIDGAISALGNCNTAMSMVVIGMILAEIDWKQFWDLVCAPVCRAPAACDPGVCVCGMLLSWREPGCARCERTFDCNACGCDNQYPRGKIWNGIGICNEDGRRIDLHFSADDLFLEYDTEIKKLTTLRICYTIANVTFL